MWKYNNIFYFHNYVHQRLKIQSATSSIFVLKDGLFVQGLKAALHFCGIVRQAYHGWTFIRNHVHNASKKSSSSCKCTNYYSIDSIEVYSVPEYNLIINQEYTATDSQTTAAVTDTAPKLKHEAAAIRTTFEQLLHLFAGCHDTYSKSKPMSDAEVDQFSKCTVQLILFRVQL